MISKKLNKTVEILLLSMLAVFPFAFKEINTRWYILLGAILVFLIIGIFLGNTNKSHKVGLATFFAILFLVIFDFSENVNFSQLLNIPNNIGWRIPLPTILLSITTLIFLIKILYQKKVAIHIPTYIKNLFFAFAFLIFLGLLFYPFSQYHYQVSLDTNIQLLNKILKYSILILLVITYTDDQKHLKRLNMGFAIVIALVLVLNIIF